MITDEVTIRFLAPAFLGGASQAAEWRSPPFKTLLRQVWRMVRAGRGDTLAAIRESEGALFGHAALKHRDTNGRESSWAFRSHVQLSLASWETGSLEAWPRLANVHHPNVQTARNGMINAGLYLGYGPLVGSGFKEGLSAIAPGEAASLRVRYPDFAQDDIRGAFSIIDAIGAVGSRSRNGWGSLAWQSSQFETAPAHQALQSISRDLDDCLRADWPRAVGRDDRGLLVWQTEPFLNWQQLVKPLAELKIAVRVRFADFQRFRFGSRHLLGVPLTHHSVEKWNKNTRLAGQLRFKVADAGDGRVLGRIVHIPCALPQALAKPLGHGAPSVPRQLDVWRQVHETLDNNLERLGSP